MTEQEGPPRGTSSTTNGSRWLHSGMVRRIETTGTIRSRALSHPKREGNDLAQLQARPVPTHWPMRAGRNPAFRLRLLLMAGPWPA